MHAAANTCRYMWRLILITKLWTRKFYKINVHKQFIVFACNVCIGQLKHKTSFTPTIRN